MPSGRRWVGAGRSRSRPRRWRGRGTMQSIAVEGALAVDETPRIGPCPAPLDWESLSMDCRARSRYTVRFCDSLLESGALPEALGDRRALLVTTPTVHRIYGSAIRAVLRETNTVAELVLDAREETKSIQLVEAVCAEALAR